MSANDPAKAGPGDMVTDKVPMAVPAGDPTLNPHGVGEHARLIPEIDCVVLGAVATIDHVQLSCDGPQSVNTGAAFVCICEPLSVKKLGNVLPVCKA
jgi:hypothetical protein